MLRPPESLPPKHVLSDFVQNYSKSSLALNFLGFHQDGTELMQSATLSIRSCWLCLPLGVVWARD